MWPRAIWIMFRALFFILLASMIVRCSNAPDSVPVTEGPATAAEAPPAESLPPGIVAAESEWETVARGFVYTASPLSDGAQGLYFAEPIQNRIYHIHSDGTLTVFTEDTGMNMGLARGPDERIYGCRNRSAQIVVYAPDGSFEVLLQGELTPLPGQPQAPGEFCNDLAINAAGGIWYTDRVNRRVMYLAPDLTVRVVADGFRPNGIVLSPDEQLLVVTDSNEPRLWAFAVGDNGALAELPDYFPAVRTVDWLGDEPIAPGRPGTNGMTVDSDGRFYLTSFYGIQVFERDGRYIGSIASPSGFVSDVGFAGGELEYLYATGINGVYRRLMQARGVVPVTGTAAAQ